MERSALDRLLAEARAGRGGALVVRGEAGIGKSALIDHALGSAGDMRVVRATGIESERGLAFAALHQLCVPMLEGLERLPAPQQDALATALGLGGGIVSDRFLVGLAVLSLVSKTAESRPLVLVADDAQWLDRPSAQTLGFVARRVSAQAVAVLVAARHVGKEFRRVPELPLRGLRPAEARALLESVPPSRLDERVRDQIVAEAGGNPRLILELPRRLTRMQLAGGFGLPAALALGTQPGQELHRRLAALPEETRRLLLVVAAEPGGEPALLWRAAARLGIGSHRLRQAERAGLIELGATVRFPHLHIRAAVYRSASLEERRAVHRALAEASDRATDADRRARHLAEATAAPEAAVADALEDAVGRAQARAGLPAAAAFRERAALFTVDAKRRADRALAAAQANFEAGSFDRALSLATTVEAGAVDDRQRVHVRLLRAQVSFASQRGSEAPAQLLRAASELRAADPDLARATYLECLAAARYGGRLAREVDVREAGRAARGAPPSAGPPGPSDLLLDGLAIRYTEGYAAAAPTLGRALRGFRREAVLPARERRWLWLASTVAYELFDDGTARLLARRGLELARRAGALTVIPALLGAGSMVWAASGELGALASAAEELRAVTQATRTAPIVHGELWLAALRGDERELSDMTAAAAGDAVTRGEGLVLSMAELAGAILHNGLGHYDAALAVLVGVVERRRDTAMPAQALAELVEASVRCGRLDLATRALERLTDTAGAAGSEWARGVRSRSCALVADGDDALFHDAIDRLGRTSVVLELARAHLLYGEWLRRRRRRLDAREQLRVAREKFVQIGADAFASRAERELLATGERVRRRVDETRDELTAREAQIARLACTGLSNAEIGTQLFISPRTVEYHLHKVFSKLRITSRNELRGPLAESAALAA